MIPLYQSLRESLCRIQNDMDAGTIAGWPPHNTPPISGVSECVVQYVDMSDSTKLAIQLPPTQYASLVTAFCRETAMIVIRHGGYPIKYVGDAVVSVFAGYSLHAVDTALGSAISTMRMIHHALVPGTGVPIRAHVGMSYGVVAAIPQGNDIDILGAPVNLAAKLLQIRHPIVMDDSFRGRLHPEYVDVIQLDVPWIYGGNIYEYTGGFHC